jgi:hypothetical protein
MSVLFYTNYNVLLASLTRQCLCWATRFTNKFTWQHLVLIPILNFIDIRRIFSKLKHVKWQTLPPQYAFTICTLCRERVWQVWQIQNYWLEFSVSNIFSIVRDYSFVIQANNIDSDTSKFDINIKSYWHLNFPPRKIHVSCSLRLIFVVRRIILHQRRRLYNMSISVITVKNEGARGSVVVKALCCKPEGRGFKSRWGGFFKLT